jgi:ubiquinone/menaquinone biosynthesis C-methylase UbiE
MSFKKKVKKILPKTVISILFKIKQTIQYRNYDSSTYWKNRAKCDGQSSVLWKNENFNKLYREKQKKIIAQYLNKINIKVLDIGCGTGYVSKMMVDINPNINIDAVDFDEMIIEAKKRNSHNNIHYISSSAENYYDKDKQYDLVLSSGCFSAIRDIEKLEKAIHNTALMTKNNGIVLMIDPFHKWNYLARVKYNSKDVEKYMNSLGFKLMEKSGVIFWPYRDKYANSNLSMDELRDKFENGEKILHFLGSHLWADYKILLFKKVDD